MGYEIDFLAVGEESSGGDAIAIRYGDLTGPRESQTVIVIDGGYTETGAKLVQHIQTYFDTNRVDLVVSTHPDQDHVMGLEVVLEELAVGELWMHQPWRHSAALAQARGSEFKSLQLSEKVQKSLGDVSDLEAIATRRGIPITEPFTGLATIDGTLRILGPTREFYESMLAEIQPQTTAQKALAALAEMAKRLVAKLVPETMERETLRDDGVVSPQNNSSAISLLQVDGHALLFTGDAGIPALDSAVAVLEGEGWSVGDLKFVQIPHHGSRRNVGPSVLNRLLGGKGQTSPVRTAYASVPAKNADAKHPAKKVTNAFIRRGCTVYLTQGSSLWHHNGAPARANYGPVDAHPFHDLVEEDDEA